MIGQHATDGAQMAVNYINKELGGVGGHPVQLDTCFIASAEEEGNGCAQKFLANKSIDVVAMGAVVIGDQSFYATLGGKLPVVGGVAPLPIDGAQKNTAVLFGRRHQRARAVRHLRPKDVLHAKTAGAALPQHRLGHPRRAGHQGGAQGGRHLREDGPVPGTRPT